MTSALAYLHGWLDPKYNDAAQSLWDDLDAIVQSMIDDDLADEDPAGSDGPNGVQNGAERCEDCQWVQRPQRWVDMANDVEPELVLGKPCRKHGGPCGECRECRMGHWLRCSSPAARAVPTDDDLREAIGRAKKAVETRAGRQASGLLFLDILEGMNPVAGVQQVIDRERARLIEEDEG